MIRHIFIRWESLCFLLGLLLGGPVAQADTCSGISAKMDDRKIQFLKGNVSEVMGADGTFARFDEEGNLIQSKDRRFSCQMPYTYVLEKGVIAVLKREYSENGCSIISCDTGKKVEEYLFDKEGRMVEHRISSGPTRKYQYFFRGTETLPYKEVYSCDTLPLGPLTYYYQYLRMDKEGNWLQRAVKISGGSTPQVNRLYVDTRRLKYYPIPAGVISSVKGDAPRWNFYEEKLLNMNSSDIQKAYERGKTNLEIISPESVEVGEEFEIAFGMKQIPKDVHVGKSKQFEFLGYDFRLHTAVADGDTVKSFQFVFKLKAKQKGKWTLPSLKVRLDGKPNLSSSPEIAVVDPWMVPCSSGKEVPLTLSATLSKDTIHLGESVFLSLRICTSYSELTSAHLSQPGLVSCSVQEIPLDSVAWEKVSFGKDLYKIGEYKRFKLTPARAGNVEIPPFACECAVRNFTFPNAGLLKNVSTPSSLLGIVTATVTTLVATKPKIENRNESVHTEPLRLYVLP